MEEFISWSDKAIQRIMQYWRKLGWDEKKSLI